MAQFFPKNRYWPVSSVPAKRVASLKLPVKEFPSTQLSLNEVSIGEPVQGNVQYKTCRRNPEKKRRRSRLSLCIDGSEFKLKTLPSKRQLNKLGELEMLGDSLCPSDAILEQGRQTVKCKHRKAKKVASCNRIIKEQIDDSMAIMINSDPQTPLDVSKYYCSTRKLKETKQSDTSHDSDILEADEQILRSNEPAGSDITLFNCVEEEVKKRIGSRHHSPDVNINWSLENDGGGDKKTFNIADLFATSSPRKVSKKNSKRKGYIKPKSQKQNNGGFEVFREQWPTLDELARNSSTLKWMPVTKENNGDSGDQDLKETEEKFKNMNVNMEWNLSPPQKN